MPSPLRARVLRTLAAVMLLVALLVPGSAPALAADGEPLVLRAGTDQDLQVLNPWNSVVVADFEVFTLNPGGNHVGDLIWSEMVKECFAQ